jgi:hypothetical protein
MAIDLSLAPYYDDFNDDKGFHKLLFRPGRAVQARELTQLQTILQNQMARFGQNIFLEGTVVIPGGVTIDTNYEYVKLSAGVLANLLRLMAVILIRSTFVTLAAVQVMVDALAQAKLSRFKTQPLLMAVTQLLVRLLLRSQPLLVLVLKSTSIRVFTSSRVTSSLQRLSHSLLRNMVFHPVQLSSV